ncbi:MAG: hypothetical protein DBX51_02300 [Clostridiales bacterium]|nr:MAG: hypothetical protein DBX51_02300 [Clostridiales bacterium]
MQNIVWFLLFFAAKAAFFVAFIIKERFARVNEAARIFPVREEAAVPRSGGTCAIAPRMVSWRTVQKRRNRGRSRSVFACARLRADRREACPPAADGRRET